ncbi:MAG: DUF3179 domain-containing protein [Caldilineae bacterium]|nr:MAG: DUF3179 domain-containing protein [Caldilineae bacterium]
MLRFLQASAAGRAILGVHFLAHPRLWMGKEPTMGSRRNFSALVAAMFVLSACVQATPPPPMATDLSLEPPAPATALGATSRPAQELLPTPTPRPPVAVPEISAQEQQFLMQGYRWLIPFDGIRPVYNPRFTNGETADLDPEELVIGIAVNGEAKAYPVSVLRFREMVNDEIGGLPILVTW